MLYLMILDLKLVADKRMHSRTRINRKLAYLQSIYNHSQLIGAMMMGICT